MKHSDTLNRTIAQLRLDALKSVTFVPGSNPKMIAKAKGLAPPHVIGLALDEYIHRLAPEDRARYDYYAEVVRLSRSSPH